MDSNQQLQINIAITDDHQLWHDELNKSLPPLGINVIINALNGKELLEKISAATQLPDVCLLDVNMPVMDGYETAKELKVRYPGIGIVAFSMDDDQRTVEGIREAGADAFLWKCCRIEELQTTLCDMASKQL